MTRPRFKSRTSTHRTPSSRNAVPLAARLRFSDTTELLGRIVRPAPALNLPVLASPLSRRTALVHAAVRVLLLWRLERHHALHGHLRASPTWPTAEAHRCGPLASDALDILADSTRTWQEYSQHGHVEHHIARSALAVAAVRLAGQGRPEHLEEGLDDDSLADVLQIGRLPIPERLTQAAHADLAGHDGAEDALIDGAPLVMHTRTRLDLSDRQRAAATLLDARSRGHLAHETHLWLTRHVRLLTLTHHELLSVPLDEADDAWAELLR